MSNTQNPKGGVAPVSTRVANLSNLVRQNARQYTNRVAIAWGDAQWTWATIDARIDALTAALIARGVTKGDRVLVQSRNCNQMFEAMFACFRAGAVYVPTNFRQTADEVAYLAKASGASAMICGRDFPAHAAACTAASPAIRFTLSIGPADFGDDIDTIIAQQAGQKPPMADVDYNDPAWFFFTSGTTGRPKAAVLTHGQLAFIINNHIADLMPGLGPTDVSLLVAPLSHGAGIHQLVQVARGVPTIMLASERFDPDEAWSLVQKWRVTNMFTVPTIVKMLTEHEAVDRYDHTTLRHVIYAGAPMYREDQKHALHKLGPVLVQYFGLGEVTGAITVFPPALHTIEDGPDARPGTCGFPRTGMQISIQDATGHECAPNQTGEICVCGPGVFAGYYDNPEANAKAFRDGWFRTGDLGHLDAEGFLFITGRESDMYISGGSNVYPREIEEKILKHADITEVAVLGMPDRTWGEIGVAVCVLRPGATLTQDALLQWLDNQVTRYKLPRQVHFWDELPKSAYGKITKKNIRAELEARTAAVPA